MPEVNRKDGRLTVYGFHCGYVEEYGNWLAGDGVRLYRESSGEYHVRGQAAEGPQVWECFDETQLDEARRFARGFGRYADPRVRA